MAKTTTDSIGWDVDAAVGERPEAVRDYLEAVSTAVRNTAAHIEETWQDRTAARAWERIARAIDRAVSAYDRNRPF